MKIYDVSVADAPRAAAPARSSFAKGLSVLAWVQDHDGLRADEIATALDLPTSSVYRYLRALREAEFVAEDSGRYRPGPRAAARTSAAIEPGPAALAAPFLTHLVEVTGETAVLTVRHGLHAVCVRQVESRHQIRLAFELGQLLPLYAGAGQRVLLAFAPEEVQRAILQDTPHPYTPDTPTRAELARALPQIRRDGVALSRAEIVPGSVAIAVPVLVGRYAVAGICLAGPRNRCGPDWQRIARRELTAAAASIATALAETSPA